MPADAQLLAQLLALAGLLAATAEYSHIIRRRGKHRQLLTERSIAAQSGLEGLVRVFLTER